MVMTKKPYYFVSVQTQGTLLYLASSVKHGDWTYLTEYADIAEPYMDREQAIAAYYAFCKRVPAHNSSKSKLILVKIMKTFKAAQ